MKKIKYLLMFGIMTLLLTGCSISLSSIDAYFGKSVSNGFKEDIAAAQKLGSFLYFDTEKTEEGQSMTKYEVINKLVNDANKAYNDIMSQSISDVKDLDTFKTGFYIKNSSDVAGQFKKFLKEQLVDMANNYCELWNKTLRNYLDEKKKTEPDQKYLDTLEASLNKLKKESESYKTLFEAKNNGVQTDYSKFLEVATVDGDGITKIKFDKNLSSASYITKEGMDYDKDDDLVIACSEFLEACHNNSSPSLDEDGFCNHKFVADDFWVEMNMRDGDDSIFNLNDSELAALEGSVIIPKSMIDELKNNNTGISINKKLYAAETRKKAFNIIKKVSKGDIYVLDEATDIDISKYLTADDLNTKFRDCKCDIDMFRDSVAKEKVDQDQLFAVHKVPLKMSITTVDGKDTEIDFGSFAFEGFNTSLIQTRLLAYQGEAPSFTYANSKWYLIRYPIGRLESINKTSGDASKGMKLKKVSMPSTYVTLGVPGGAAPGTLFSGIRGSDTAKTNSYSLSAVGLTSYLYTKDSVQWVTKDSLQVTATIDDMMPSEYVDFLSKRTAAFKSGAFLLDYLEGTFIFDTNGNALYPANTPINSASAEPILALGRKIRLNKGAIVSDWSQLTTGTVIGNIMETMSNGSAPSALGDNVTIGELISVTKGNLSSSTTTTTTTSSTSSSNVTGQVEQQGAVVKYPENSSYEYIGYNYDVIKYGDTLNNNPVQTYIYKTGRNNLYIVTKKPATSSNGANNVTLNYYKSAGSVAIDPTKTYSTTDLQSQYNKYYNQNLKFDKAYYRVWTEVTETNAFVRYLPVKATLSRVSNSNSCSVEIDFGIPTYGNELFKNITIDYADGVDNISPISYIGNKIKLTFVVNAKSSVISVVNNSTANNRLFDRLTIQLTNWDGTKYALEQLGFFCNIDQKVLTDSEIEDKRSNLYPTSGGTVDVTTTTTSAVGRAVKMMDKDHAFNSKSTMGGVANIPVIYKKVISVGALKYGGNMSGQVVFAANENIASSQARVPLYILGRDFDFQNTQFQTGWILNDSTNSPNGNLAMWIAFLKEYGYQNYPLGDLNGLSLEELRGKLSGILKRVYNFGQEEDIDSTIILDPRVIQVVQDEIDEKNTATEAKIIRASAKIIGFLLAFYGFFLLLAYLIDSGTSGEGDGLLYKVTFHKMKAATGMSKKEAVELSTAGYKYVTLGALGLRVFLLMSLGVTLLIVDPIQVVSVIVGWVDGVVTTIKSSIFNSK